MQGNRGIMLLYEYKSLPFGMQSNDSPDNQANSSFDARYSTESEQGSRIRRLNLKNARMMRLINQQSQVFVRFSLLESLKADSWNVGDKVRELLLEVLTLI